MSESTTYVGMDVHKRTVVVAMLLPGRTEPVEWQEPNDATVARRLARRLLRESPGEVVCCYEAGPTGYMLQRRLRAEGVMKYTPFATSLPESFVLSQGYRCFALRPT